MRALEIRGVRGRLLGIVSVCLVGLSGCRDDGRVPVYPVKGKVTVAGEVPEGALIILHSAKPAGESDPRPSGKVGKDGSFSLTSFDADDGAPPGEYTATIQWNKLVKKGDDFVAGPDAVPKEFATPATSPWKIKVAEASNEIPAFEIIKR